MQNRQSQSPASSVLAPDTFEPINGSYSMYNLAWPMKRTDMQSSFPNSHNGSHSASSSGHFRPRPRFPVEFRLLSGRLPPARGGHHPVPFHAPPPPPVKAHNGVWDYPQGNENPPNRRSVAQVNGGYSASSVSHSKVKSDMNAAEEAKSQWGRPRDFPPRRMPSRTPLPNMQMQGDQRDWSPSQSSHFPNSTSGPSLSRGGGNIGPNGPFPPALHVTIHKTRLCVYLTKGRPCPKRDCSFAHSTSELRQRPDLHRTKLCRAFIDAGTCESGSECRFAHGLQELRHTKEFYKTALCAVWRNHGACKAGERCRFAHGTSDLRANLNRPLENGLSLESFHSSQFSFSRGYSSGSAEVQTKAILSGRTQNDQFQNDINTQLATNATEVGRVDGRPERIRAEPLSTNSSSEIAPLSESCKVVEKSKSDVDFFGAVDQNVDKNRIANDEVVVLRNRPDILPSTATKDVIERFRVKTSDMRQSTTAACSIGSITSSFENSKHSDTLSVTEGYSSLNSIDWTQRCPPPPPTSPVFPALHFFTEPQSQSIIRRSDWRPPNFWNAPDNSTFDERPHSNRSRQQTFLMNGNEMIVSQGNLIYLQQAQRSNQPLLISPYKSMPSDQQVAHHPQAMGASNTPPTGCIRSHYTQDGAFNSAVASGTPVFEIQGDEPQFRLVDEHIPEANFWVPAPQARSDRAPSPAPSTHSLPAIFTSDPDEPLSPSESRALEGDSPDWMSHISQLKPSVINLTNASVWSVQYED